MVNYITYFLLPANQDNSNLIESYSGVILPLTESFAKELYSNVYKKVALASGISKKKIKLYKKEFENLIGSFYGRFYYNMLNWYKMLTIFPGYERNKKNLDLMITAKSKADLDNQYRKNVNLLFKIKYYLLISYKYLNLEKSIQSFKFNAEKILREWDDDKINSLNYEQCLKFFRELERKLISSSHIPIENDFVAMTFNGLLMNSSKKKKIPQSLILENLASIEGLNTSKQINELHFLSKEVFQNKKISNLIKKKEYNKINKEIIKFPRLNKLVGDYFKRYGGRFANELKLESKELTKDSSEFYELLESYSKINISKKVKKVKKLPLPQRYYLKKTKEHLRKREEMRILRAQIFSLTRKFFLKMAEILNKEKAISKKEDIFYLKLNELYKNHNSLKEIIIKRKKEYLGYKKREDLPSVLYTDKKGKILSYEKEDFVFKKHIIGKPCSTGTINGKASLIIGSNPKLNKKYGIIITKTADPGWAPVLSLCDGIIIEKGGLLSHISILARELRVPCIIEAENITKIVKTGDNILMNGTNGTIKINN